MYNQSRGYHISYVQPNSTLLWVIKRKCDQVALASWGCAMYDLGQVGQVPIMPHKILTSLPHPIFASFNGLPCPLNPLGKHNWLNHWSWQNHWGCSNTASRKRKDFFLIIGRKMLLLLLTVDQKFCSILCNTVASWPKKLDTAGPAMEMCLSNHSLTQMAKIKTL